MIWYTLINIHIWKFRGKQKFLQLMTNKVRNPLRCSPTTETHCFQSATSSSFAAVAWTLWVLCFLRACSPGSFGRHIVSMISVTCSGVSNTCRHIKAACCEKAWSKSSWPWFEALASWKNKFQKQRIFSNTFKVWHPSPGNYVQPSNSCKHKSGSSEVPPEESCGRWKSDSFPPDMCCLADKSAP